MTKHTTLTKNRIKASLMRKVRPGNIQASKQRRIFNRLAGRNGNKYVAASRTLTTWQKYSSHWELFKAWCARNNRKPLPATGETLLAYITCLADAGNTAATVASYVQGIATVHKLNGHAIDRRAISETMRGIRRTAGPERQAAPLLTEELRTILAALAPANPADARDGALLALGWAGALRRSELIGLDWQRRGYGARCGTGVISIGEGGIHIVLITSKSSQEETVTIDITTADMPAAHEWLSAWLSTARIEPGTPLFRPVQRGAVHWRRLGAGALTDVVRRRVDQHFRNAGLTADESASRAVAYSGHSLRAGYATSAALAGVPEWAIRRHMRHKTATMTARYIRVAESMNVTGLNGVGF